MTFTDEYVKLLSPSTDAPDIFHKMMAYFLISCAVQRQVSLEIGTFTVFPNVWMVLLGHTTQMRKSTTVGYGLKLLNKIRPGMRLDGDFSEEGVSKYLEHKSQVYIYYDEFMTMMKSFQRTYSPRLKSWMTSLYECPDSYDIQRVPKKLKDGTIIPQNIHIENIFLNVVSATTADWFADSITDEDINGGFVPRFLLVPAWRGKGYNPCPPPPDATQREIVFSQLSRISEFGGKMYIKDQDYYNQSATEIYQKLSSATRKKNLYARFEGYFQRFCILEALNNGPSLAINRSIIQKARRTILDAIMWVDDLVQNYIAETREHKMLNRILSYIPNDDYITPRDIIRKSNLRIHILEGYLKTLLKGESIERVAYKDGRGSNRFGFRRIIEMEPDNGQKQSDSIPNPELGNHLVPPPFSPF